ncbi:MAG: hypothetical protein ACXVIP_01015 [Halobacteriota archaeon]
MSNKSASREGIVNYQHVLDQIMDNRVTIFNWEEKWLSDSVAEVSIIGCEHSSLPILTFKATGVARTFESSQHAEAFVDNNTSGFVHLDNSWGDVYIRNRSSDSQLRLHLVLKPTSEDTILSCQIVFSSSGAFEVLN